MADAHGSGPCELTLMWVQLPSSALSDLRSEQLNICRSGGMADAHGSGPCELTLMWVQLPSSALSDLRSEQLNICRSGGMADAHGSGPCELTLMWVQLPSSASRRGKLYITCLDFYYIKSRQVPFAAPPLPPVVCDRGICYLTPGKYQNG